MTQPNQTNDVNVPPPEVVLMQMLFGALMQKNISVAAKLGIADLLAEKPQNADELAVQTDTHAPSLYQVLRVLASVDIFSEIADHKFELTPIAALLRADAPNSMRDFAIMQREEWLWRNFGALMHKTYLRAQSVSAIYIIFDLNRHKEN